MSWCWWMEFRGDHCWQGVQTNKCLFQKPVRSLSYKHSPPGSRPLLCQLPDLGCIGRCQLTARSFSPGCQVQSELDFPQSMGSLRVLARLSDFTFTFHFHALERKWQPTPVFLPGESQGWGSLVGCRLWGRTEVDTTEAT